MMKPKNKYEEITKQQNNSLKEIETSFLITKILTFIIIIISIGLCFANYKLQLEVTALKQEKQELIELVEVLEND